jgi:hypothetical protein
MADWTEACLEMRRGILTLIAQTNAGADDNIRESRSMTLTEVELLRASPADRLVESFRDDRTRAVAAAFVRELRRFCDADR